MKINFLQFGVFLLLSSSCSFAQTLDRAQHDQIIKKLKSPSTSTRVVHMITDEDHEAPDPTRPLQIEMPNGEKKYIIGLSGQLIIMFNDLKELAVGKMQKTQAIDLKNEFGFNYGGEIDPATGKPYGYSADSSTWDISLFNYPNTEGARGLRVLAGAMANSENRTPLMLKDGANNTRQRLFFEAGFDSNMKLHADKPKAVLNSGLPTNGNWIEKDAKGNIIFSHGYGGEPVTLLNGDLFIDERGWVPFVYETVVEQRERRESNGTLRMIPYRTAIVVTYLDKNLTKVMAPAKIIFDVFKPNGQVWAAAQRPTAGPLVEGAHIEVRAKGHALESMKEVEALRAQGSKLDFQMLFSAGEYFGTYGSFMATSSGDLESFKPVLNDDGELRDLTAPLRVLFTWIGRPVSFHVDGQEFLIIHGVDRNSVPQGLTLDQRPLDSEWPYYRRQEIVVPVERIERNGVPELQIKDEDGLIELLKGFIPRKISMLQRVDLRTA